MTPIANSLGSVVSAVSLTQRDCMHCRNPVPSFLDSEFCCQGCETVYFWIKDHKLDWYYDLKQKGRPLRKARPISSLNESYSYLDDPEFQAVYSWESPEGKWMEFYVEGVHCAACIWLTEKVADGVDHVGSVRLNLGTSVATVRIEKEGLFSNVASELQKMGYRPHPIRRGDINSLQSKENRLLLVRLGVAGASAGNIMLLAISLYGGASGPLGDHLRWISFILFLPVIFFAATPFYRSAWAALSTMELSIDIPVVVGILTGSLVSIANLLTGDGRIYFDSLSSLVFLLLATRYLLKRAQQISLNSSRTSYFSLPSRVRKWNAAEMRFESQALDKIQTGDRVRILAGESVPIDGSITQGTSFLDCSLLTGESKPQRVAPGDFVFAGTLNLDSPLDVDVTQSGSQTRIGKIVSSMEMLLTRKAKITLFADRISRYFIVAVCILSILIFAWSFTGPWVDGLNRVLAVSIVTCPCTFALITPLVLSLTLGRLAKVGILVKSSDVLERLAEVKSVFLDKTGTLTFGTPYVVSWEVPSELSPAILAIEKLSHHPIARALVQYLSSAVPEGAPTLSTPITVHETLGEGIRAEIDGELIEIKRSQTADETTELSVFKNHLRVGRIVLNDRLRPESPTAVNLLKSMKLDPWILSGDHRTPVTNVGKLVGIDPQHCCFEATPEIKGQTVARHAPALMVGDGANDAPALAQAFVSVAVHGGVETSLRAADVYLGQPGLLPLCDLLTISRETLKVVRRNLVFSILYNIIAGGFALFGKIDPLFAAILMPMSAFTVFLSSLAGTSKMRKAMKRLEA